MKKAWTPPEVIRLSLLVGGLVLLSGCGGSTGGTVQTPPVSPEPPVIGPLVAFAQDGKLEARIRWTQYGIPHIEADNLESLGWGAGYAFARDNLCVLAEQVVRFNSERSRYFGPDREVTGDGLNLVSDFGYLTLRLRERAQTGLPLMSDRSRALIRGYVRGYNKWLESGPASDQDPRCENQPWVRPLEPVDLLTYALGIAVLPGAEQFLDGLFAAAPPNPTLAQQANATAQHESESSTLASLADQAAITHGAAEAADARLADWQFAKAGPASNGWALGRDRTSSGQGMLLANPHFPWQGNLRFWQSHVRIPGHLDTMGASLPGLPGIVNIGFNQHVAWTHTFSTAEHIVIYALPMDSARADGLNYLVDDAGRVLDQRTLQITVRDAGGNLSVLEKVVYDSEFGPVLEIPGLLDWNSEFAFAISDANLPNFDIIDHWLAMNLATSLEEFKQTFQDWDGLIFNNTLAVDAAGTAFYIDDSAVPDLSASALALLSSEPRIRQIREQTGLAILPASESTRYTGLVPFDRAPQLERRDYVQNSNDSSWLTNPAQPLTGYSPLYGPVASEQSFRTRLGLRMLDPSDTASGSDGQFTAEELVDTIFNQRTFVGENLLSPLQQACSTRLQDQYEQLDVASACNALSLWSGRMTLDSRAGHLAREFAAEFTFSDLTSPWQTGFDPARPVTTPAGIGDDEIALTALARAAARIRAAGVALDAPLRSLQFIEPSTLSGAASGNRFPIAGASDIEGGFNIMEAVSSGGNSLLPQHNYASSNVTGWSQVARGYHVIYGASWLSVVEFGTNGPKALGLLAYSQSSNPRSPHFFDQTRILLDDETLVPLPYTEAEIVADLQEAIVLTSE